MIEKETETPVQAGGSFGSTDKTKEFKDYKRNAKGGYNRRARRGAKGPKGLPTKGGNDFEFWNAYPELMGIATRFPWMHIAGTPLVGNNFAINLPNVAIQHYFSVPGVSENATDPLNLAFRQLFLDMHRKYRGIGSYQASDIAIVLICIESVLQLLVEAERVYGILKGYPIKSRIEPEGLLLAMGYSQTFIDSMKAHLADYRYGVNRLIELAKRLPLPAGMNFFRNHVALNGFVYRDSKDERSALIAFVCDNYYKWTTVGSTSCINSASTAVSVDFIRSNFVNYNDILNVIESELVNLLSDTDVLRITSDFISCYGENNMQVLMPLPEDYTVQPVFSESILHKWHNSMRYAVDRSSTTLGALRVTYLCKSSTTTQINTLYTFAIYQENDVIISAPALTHVTPNTGWSTAVPGIPAAQVGLSGIQDAKYGVNDYVNDSWLAEPTQEAICESVLWKTDITQAQTNETTTRYVGVIHSASTEILTKLEVFAVSRNQLNNQMVYASSYYTVYATPTIQSGLCHFDWAPLIFNPVPGGSGINEIYGDVDNVTTVGKDVVHKVLDAALLSAFKVNLSGGARE